MCKKKCKINVMLVIFSLLYSICLILGGSILEGLNNYDTNLKISIEQSSRSSARLLLQDMVNRFDYAVGHNSLNPDDEKQVAAWCKINFAGIRNGSNMSDGFVIDLKNEQIIEDTNIDISKTDSVARGFTEEIALHHNDKEAKKIIDKIRSTNDTVSGENYSWMAGDSDSIEWLEWKVYPVNRIGMEDYETSTGIHKDDCKKYVFVLGTHKNEIFTPYVSTFMSITIIQRLIYSLLVISLVTMISFILYATYTEFKRR